MNVNFQNPDSPALILIVDDDPGIRQILRQHMEILGYQVIEAENGMQALENYQVHQPDVVLLDACMPGVNGFDCCRILMDQYHDDPPLILMLTSLSDDSSVTHAFAAGASDYVTKPVHWVLLQQRVQYLLQKAQLLQQLKQYNVELEAYAESRNITIRQHTGKLYKAITLESTLRRITDQVREVLDESQLLQTAVQELAVTLGFNYCGATVYHPELLTPQQLYEYNPLASEHYQKVLLGEGTAAVRQTLRDGNAMQLCAYPPDQPEPVSAFVFPIQNGHLVGDLWLIDDRDRELDELEIRLAEQVANQCAIGIRQARLYAAAQAQVQELKRLHELKDDFLSTVSHELRSPLTSMRMAIQLLDQALGQGRLICGKSATANGDCTRAANYVKILQTECEREIALVNDLLNLQQLEAGEYPFVPTPVCLQSWLLQTVEPFIWRTQNCKQTLQMQLASNLPLLETDPLCLRRILTELLSNACKYSPPGASITIISALEGNQFCIRVTNTGVTIADQDLTRIFNKFYRIAGSDRWKHGGTGLGLALVQKMADHLGGTIAVTSSKNLVCFTLKLPTYRHQ